MDVGTGKVTKKERGSVKHHLLDVANPKKVFTVSDFKQLAQKALNEIVSHNKLPIIVGGTGFYIDALVRDMALPEVPPNKKLRAQFDKLTAKKLYKKLKKLDPRRAKTIDAKNKRRLIRALEIIITTSKPVPRYTFHAPSFKILWLGIRPKDLNIKIKKRLDARLKQGMVSEVKNLIKKGVSKKRLYDFGLEYRWVAKYLAGEVSKQEMRDGLLQDIIKYSKRQMTWFKRNKDIFWVKNGREAERLVRKFLLA